MTILKICKDPTSKRVLLIVTEYKDHSGASLCIPIVFDKDDSKDGNVHYSAMKFINRDILHKNHQGFTSLPDIAKWEIDEYLLKNMEVFKDKIEGWENVFSPIKGQYIN